MIRYAVVSLFYDPRRIERTSRLLRQVGDRVTVVDSVAVINGDLIDSEQ